MGASNAFIRFTLGGWGATALGSAVGLAGALAALGCTGRIGAAPDARGSTMTTGGSGTTGGQGATGGLGPCITGSTRRLRRLSQREYFNVVSDLLGPEIATQGANMLPLEPTVAGFDNQDLALLVSSAFQEALANVAEKLSAKVDGTKIAPCATAGGSAACLNTFMRTFAKRAYGRNPTDDEVERLHVVAATGDTYATSVQLVVETVLQSPHMLYASELGPDVAPASTTIALTQHEVASQLSLLLTGARPDDALLEAADGARLSNPEDRANAVLRLFGTARAKDQLRLFVNGWIDMGPVAEAPKNADVFPTFTPTLAAAMQEELDAFVDAKVRGGDGTFLSLLTDTSTHIPAELVAIYGADLISQNGGSVLDPKKRKGILTLPGVLTYHSADQHSGPVERGLLVRRQLFCQDVPPPPASVVQLIAQNPIDPTDKAKTTRQKYEQHKTEAFCAACHSQFDVIGFGMEEMDGLGRFRTVENGLAVDSSGQLNDTDVDGAFVGAAELSQRLAGSHMFETCFVRQFFRFAEARVPEDSEQCVVQGLTSKLALGGGHFKDLVLAYVTDAAFGERKEDR
jgi:hypothetical protein